MTICQEAAEQSSWLRHERQALTAVGPLDQWTDEQRRLADLGVIPAGHVPAIAGPLALAVIEGGRPSRAPKGSRHPSLRGGAS